MKSLSGTYKCKPTCCCPSRRSSSFFRAANLKHGRHHYNLHNKPLTYDELPKAEDHKQILDLIDDDDDDTPFSSDDWKVSLKDADKFEYKLCVVSGRFHYVTCCKPVCM